MKKRILSILLAAIMVLAIVPFSAITAFADTPEAEITEVSTFGELLEAVNSDKEHIKLTKDIEDVVPDDELPTKHRLVFDGGKDSVNRQSMVYISVIAVCNVLSVKIYVTVCIKSAEIKVRIAIKCIKFKFL